MTERAFVAKVQKFYKEQGRHTLPWRKTHDPYRILVSEIMLQQTQVARVIPKYQAFVKRFPTVRKLAEAPLGEVLTFWQGLGYNRRAKYLHLCAKEIVTKYKGKFPLTLEELIELPGIGSYTASAVCAFAYNEPVVMIETNIRTAYLDHFFPGGKGIEDTKLLPYIKKTLPKGNSREWYAALMDYGTHVKLTKGNISRNSKHYTRQSKFKGSDREIRGAILRTVAQGSVSKKQVYTLPFKKARIDTQVKALVREGLLKVSKTTITLP